MAKTRSLYDAPFARDLVSFDCAVQFNWQQHFVDLLGKVPPTAAPTVERLQAIQHRVRVDRNGAVVSAPPKAPDLSVVAHGTELEEALKAMITGGLNAWIPFSTNVILPVSPTKFKFEKIDTGYRLTLNGPGIASTLLLSTDMRLTSGVSELPEPLRLTTEFSPGPNGFLLSSVATGNTTETAVTRDATFAFAYQQVQGFQLPASVTIKPATPEVWHYTLNDCKATTGITIEIGLPKTH
ncbi:MAG: hypothetical protein HOQ35_01810 [Acidobacteriaceae bacterium]|nr:hypothetical protein [Acidobacteriaceae bacterium]